ncbi:hypothetical protein, partial [Endozoicomonas sp. SESOKO1]|uniref:hypothetical protein n=1 Tax=Endozoicomonas sp. SESOKO1 TaxID=2828742 RepID=UPI0021496F4B
GIARFKADCCLKGLSFSGQRITPDAVVKDYQLASATLELARFKEQCCLRGWSLNRQLVTPDMVVRDYQAAKATLELARFKAECCLKGLQLKGQPVTPGEVVNDFPNSLEGKLGIARFKAECCMRSLSLNGQLVTADAVVKAFPDSPEGKLGIARFKADCCVKGLSLNDQLVTTDAVAKDYQAIRARVELALFKEQCCLRGLPLNGQLVTADDVVKAFPDSPEGKLGIARFKAECCLKNLPLNGQLVTPNMVVDHYQAAEATLELARFKAECCLKRLPLDGQQVIPDAVVKAFPDNPEGKLGIVRFKERCCLNGLLLHGQSVTPDAVAKDCQAAKATLELARFRAECCLRGLPLNGMPVTPDTVVKGFQAARATLEQARFKDQCCLKGLPLNGHQVTTDAVVKDYQSIKATLELARFRAECCLKGLPLGGLLVTPDSVFNDYQALKATLEIARFKAECCLRNLPLNGHLVTPDAVVRAFPDSPEGKLGTARFKADCCLRYLPLNGQQVIPEAVVEDYERGGLLLERAIFYSQLALNARKLNGNYLANQDVLEAFNKVSGDHSSRKTNYLIQSLKQSQQYDETDEARDILQGAWQILNNVPIKDDEQHRLQCILKFMAMQNALTIDHQAVSAEQVFQSIRALRSSFQNSRIHFFFLAHCHITGQSIGGREISKSQVLEYLQRFPERSKMRHALGHWFEQCSSEANIVDKMLFRGEHVVAPGNDTKSSSPGRNAKWVAVSVANGRKKPLPCQYRDEAEENVSASQAITDKTVHPLKPLSATCSTGRPEFPDNQVPQVNVQTLKALEIIQEVNGSCSHPPILVTGSYSRFLQSLCTSFNDIDIICSTEASARTLFGKLQALNTDNYSDIPKSIIIWPILGCQAIKLPEAYSIDLKDGDLGTKVMELNVSVDARITTGHDARLAVHVPGVERPVMCLSFAEETRLMNDTLEYLADNLDPLTDRLQKGEVLNIPRTILFNFPQNTDECIFGLLMRSLLTLNKARQFIALHSEQPPDYRTDQLQEEQQRLYTLTANLQTKLANHACRNDFEHRVNNRLATSQAVNDYLIKRQEFIKGLLAMMHAG